MDFKALQEAFSLVESLLGTTLPQPLKMVFAGFLLLGVLLLILLGILKAFAGIKELWNNQLKPAAYRPEEKRRAEARRQFAEYLLQEVQRRNRAENWRDQQFAELEAEVEAEGGRTGMLPSFWRRSGIRRERSLSRALRRSTERLILVEGEPGSGKSVAMRHIAFQMASSASKSRSFDTKLPVYVNLKEVKRSPDEKVDREFVRKIVLATLTRVNDRFVDEYVDREFDEGVKRGDWVFLFDSFDELPDVLSSTEADETINTYSGAIADFLSGFNACRGIVASRQYRGPSRAGWSTFRVLQLTERQQSDLIVKSAVTHPGLAARIEEHLAVAPEDVRLMARNPMLLGLLCEQAKLSERFPESSYEVISQYVSQRFRADAERVQVRFGLSPEDLMTVAERAAFAMTADAGLGLSPSFKQLHAEAREGGTRIGYSRFDKALEALIYIRLGRLASDESEPEKEFTFAHRRFQEFFATRVVLAENSRVTPRLLLTDARWRETAVVLLQTGEPAATAALIAKASGILDELFPDAPEPAAPVVDDADAKQRWKWPQGGLHLLGILQAGSRQNPAIITPALRQKLGRIVTAAFEGNLLDKKWALEVAAPIEESALAGLMEKALSLGSRLLDDVVYLQAGRLTSPVPRISEAIRVTTISKSFNGTLKRNPVVVRAFVARLPDAEEQLRVFRLLRFAHLVDWWVFPLLCVAAYALEPSENFPALPMIVAHWLITIVMRKTWPSTWIMGIGGYSRLLLLAFMGGMTLEDNWPQGLVIVALLAWNVFWFPAAIICAYKGQFTSPFLWILAPVGALIVALKWTIKNILVVATLSVLGAGTVLFIYYFKEVIDRIIEEGGYVFFVLSAIGLLPVILYLALAARDSWILWRLGPSLRAGLSLARMDEVYASLRTRRAAVYLLRRVTVKVAHQEEAAWLKWLNNAISRDPALSVTARSAPSLAALLLSGRAALAASRAVEPSQPGPGAYGRIASFLKVLNVLDAEYAQDQRDLLYRHLERAMAAH